MNITVPQDEPVTLNCKASVGIKNPISGAYSLSSNNGNSGLRPQLAIEWFKEGELVQTSSQGDPHAHRILLPDGSLFFLGAVRGRDDGVYWCVATNNFGFVRSKNATLHVACKYKSHIELIQAHPKIFRTIMNYNINHKRHKIFFMKWK